MTRIYEPGAEDGEIHVIWRAVERESESANSVIFVVVPSEKRGPVFQMIKRKEAKGEIQAKVVVATPESLQDEITSTLTRPYRKLFLLTASAVDTITFEVSNMVESVHVAPCQPTRRQDVLRIGSLSTYCGWRVYAWPQRSEQLTSYQFEQGEGCFFNIDDDLGEAKRLLGTPGSAPEITEAEVEAIKNMLMELRDSDTTGPSSDNKGSTWWDKWKLVVAACMGCAAGVAGSATFMWANAGGIFLKGSIGFTVAVQLLSMGAGGGGMAVVAGAGLAAAGAMVYFIPWEEVKLGLKQILRRVWETIEGVMGWVWEKIKEMASAVRSAAEGAFRGLQGRRVKIQ